MICDKLLQENLCVMTDDSNLIFYELMYSPDHEKRKSLFS